MIIIHLILTLNLILDLQHVYARLNLHFVTVP